MSHAHNPTSLLRYANKGKRTRDPKKGWKKRNLHKTGQISRAIAFKETEGGTPDRVGQLPKIWWKEDKNAIAG